MCPVVIRERLDSSVSECICKRTKRKITLFFIAGWQMQGKLM